MKTENNKMATHMLERDAQLRTKFEERKAHMAANNGRIKTPDGGKPPKRCDSVRIVTDDGKRHTAYVCDAKHQPNDWGTDYPSFTLTCRLVWGRCDAADFALSIGTEMLSPRTAKLCPWHISEISLPKWNVVFSDGSIIDMKYCRLTPITDMQTIRDSANVQRIIEDHFAPERLIQKAAESNGDGKQSPFHSTAHNYVVNNWRKFKEMRRGELRATYKKFLKHPDHKDKLASFDIRSTKDIQRILDCDSKKRK